MAPAGTVTFKSEDPQIEVTTLLGDEYPTVTGGYGGWQLVERNRDVSLTRWRGREPYRMQVPFLLDGWLEGRSIESDYSAMEGLALPTRKVANGYRPPFVTVSGPVPHTSVKWVVEELSWGEASGDASGLRLRQAGTVTLLEYVNTDLATGRRVGGSYGLASEGVNAQGSVRFTRVKPGEDLRDVAKRTLGKASRWGEIARLNGLRDHRSVKPGQGIRLP